jgi:hypothetical protein
VAAPGPSNWRRAVGGGGALHRLLRGGDAAVAGVRAAELGGAARSLSGGEVEDGVRRRVVALEWLWRREWSVLAAGSIWARLGLDLGRKLQATWCWHRAQLDSSVRREDRGSAGGHSCSRLSGLEEVVPAVAPLVSDFVQRRRHPFLGLYGSTRSSGTAVPGLVVVAYSFAGVGRPVE